MYYNLKLQTKEIVTSLLTGDILMKLHCIGLIPYVSKQMVSKVRISEKATKFCKIFKDFCLQYIKEKVRWRFRKNLWPSQNTWTLQVKSSEKSWFFKRLNTYQQWTIHMYNLLMSENLRILDQWLTFLRTG